MNKKENTIIHTRNNDIFLYPCECYRIISIDPGIVNLAVRIEIRKDQNVYTEILTKHKLKCKNEENIYINLINILLTYENYYKNCHFIIIEKQVKMNQNMIKLSQHIISFFLMNTRQNIFKPIIIELDSHIKGRLLPKCNKGDHKEIKRYSIQKAMELLMNRNDINGWNILNSEKKKDDLSDVIVQAEAFWLFCEEIYNYKT